MATPRIRDFEVGGNLVDDPKQIRTNSGRNLTVFTLAENTYIRGQNNERVPGETLYYDVAINADDRNNGNLAQNVAASFKKGDYVNVEGSYKAEAYVDKETGEARVGHRIFANDVTPSLKFVAVSIHPNNAQTQQAPQAQASAQVNQAPLANTGQVDHQQAAQQQMMNQAPDANASMH